MILRRIAQAVATVWPAPDAAAGQCGQAGGRQRAARL